MRRLALGIPLAVGTVCGAYTIIYLVRWEWNRAIIAGLFFVAVELVFIGMVLVDRLRTLEARIDLLAGGGARPRDARDPEVLDAIHESAPPARDHFGWLRDRTGTTSVFLPVLLGAGVLASALAWVVEHVARATLNPVRERRLADSLGVLRPPAGGLLGSTPTAMPARVGRRLLVATGIGIALVATAVATAGAVDFVADRTQTRPDVIAAGVETEIELELYGELAGRDPERTFAHLWSMCTGPHVFRSRQLPPPEVEHGPHGHFWLQIPTHVGDHAMDRLRGCLNDATLDKVRSRVLRVEMARS